MQKDCIAHPCVICTPVLWHYLTLPGCCCREKCYTHMLVSSDLLDAYWSCSVIIAMGREGNRGKSNVSETGNRCFCATIQFAESCWSELNYWRGVWNVFLKDVYLSYRTCIRNLNISLFWSIFRFQDELGWFHQYESWSGMGLSVFSFRLCAAIWQSDWLQLFLGRTVKWTKFFWFWVDVFCFAGLTLYLWFIFLYMEYVFGKIEHSVRNTMNWIKAFILII